MPMKYLAAYALAALSKPSPSQEDVKAICKSVNIPVDDATLAFVFESIAQRDVATLIAEGASKMVATAASAAPAGAAPAAAGGAAPAAKKVEKVEEEEDDEMGFGLFD